MRPTWDRLHAQVNTKDKKHDHISVIVPCEFWYLCNAPCERESERLKREQMDQEHQNELAQQRQRLKELNEQQTEERKKQDEIFTKVLAELAAVKAKLEQPPPPPPSSVPPPPIVSESPVMVMSRTRGAATGDTPIRPLLSSFLLLRADSV